MARPALPRASFLGTALRGGVAPASAGTVSVPLKNPALEMQAQSYGSLAQRLNAFSQQAFGIAETRAKKAGQVYGITNAPTLEQVESAAKLGQPVEVEGDISSTRAFDQAAYAGSMAVVESHYATAAQKAMTDIFVRADADNTMTPAEVQMQMQAAVTEYTKSLSMLDAASAAKLTNKLGVMANSKYVEFSRSYANRMQKKMVDDAVIAVDDHLDKVLPPIIKGYDATNSELALDTSIRSERANIAGMLELRGVGIVKRNEILDRFDKLVIENKIDAIVRMADNATGTDPKADVVEMIKKLKKGNADESKQEIYNSLDPEQRRKALGDLFSAGTAMKRQLGEDEDAKDAAKISVYGQFQNEIWGDNPDYEGIKKRILADKTLEPKGDYGKDSLLTRLNQIINEGKTAAKSTGPTPAQRAEWAEFLDKIKLPYNDPNRLTVEKLQKMEITILPLTGNQGINRQTLISIAKEDKTADEKALTKLKDVLLKQVRTEVGAKEFGPPNPASDLLYTDALADLELMIRNEIKAGNMDELLRDDLFVDGSKKHRAFLSYYKGQIQGLEKEFSLLSEQLTGRIPTSVKNVPFNEFQMNVNAIGTNFTKLAKYLSGKNVFDRKVTAEQAEEWYKSVRQ